MLNFSRLKIGFIISSILIFFYIFLGNFNFANKTNLFLDKKINLGLDLKGGSYLLLEIDMNPLINKKLEEKASDLKKNFNEKKLDFKNLSILNNKITFEIKNHATELLGTEKLVYKCGLYHCRKRDCRVTRSITLARKIPGKQNSSVGKRNVTARREY